MTEHQILQMTGDQIVAILLWRTAMGRMAELNSHLLQPSQRQSAPIERQEMRTIAKARLSLYFAQVERMIARNRIPDTPGDRKRQVA